MSFTEPLFNTPLDDVLVVFCSALFVTFIAMIYFVERVYR